MDCCIPIPDEIATLTWDDVSSTILYGESEVAIRS